jgi:hypothetical protein
MTKRAKSEHLTLRVPSELRDALQQAAEQDRRPVGSLVRNVLSDWIEHRAADDRPREVA